MEIVGVLIAKYEDEHVRICLSNINACTKRLFTPALKDPCGEGLA
jgi:hypothetical protein